MIISFAGVDGSGKSTYAKWTGEFLESHGYRVIIYHIFKFSLYFQLGKILRLLSAKKADSIVEDQYSKEKRKTFAHKFLLMVRTVCFVFDVIFFKIIFLKFYKKAGTYYIFDRFFMDQVVQLYYLEAIGERLFAFLLRNSVLSDIPFFLKLDANEAMKRKPEFPTEYYERKSYLYDFIIQHSKVVTVENRDREETQHKIEKILKGFLENEKK